MRLLDRRRHRLRPDTTTTTSVEVVVPTKQARKQCSGETAMMTSDPADKRAQTLELSMMCAGEPHRLSLLLKHPIDRERVGVTRESSADFVVTLHKQKRSVWWSSLTKHPEKYGTLIQLTAAKPRGSMIGCWTLAITGPTASRSFR